MGNIFYFLGGFAAQKIKNIPFWDFSLRVFL